MITLPKDFIVTFPSNEKDDFLKSLEENPETSIRLHPEKISEKLIIENVSWCEHGYYLDKRPIFTFDPLFHGGGYYVQEAGSMFIGEVVAALNKKYNFHSAFDLCAAPGGKTTHILSSINQNAMLVANEIIRQRAFILLENLTKWGKENFLVTNNSPDDFRHFKNKFDLINVDAPCSGEGMFRKEEAAITEWSLQNVEMCASRQKDILSDAMEALQPGGILIYSTCTYNEKENENIVQWLQDNYKFEAFDFPMEIEKLQSTGIQFQKIDNAFTFRFFPHRTKSEGFFVAFLQKKKDEFHLKEKEVKTNSFPELENCVQNFSEYDLITSFGENFHFTKRRCFSFFNAAKDKLNILRLGLKMGTYKGKDFIPDHELSQAVRFNKNKFDTMELDYHQAIQFLQREIPSNINSNSNGWGYFTYKNLPLGWYKSFPGRMNNYLPKELKIRMKYDENSAFSLLK